MRLIYDPSLPSTFIRNVSAFHFGLNATAREQLLDAFASPPGTYVESHEIDVLVASDILACGVHINNVAMVCFIFFLSLLKQINFPGY